MLEQFERRLLYSNLPKQISFVKSAQKSFELGMENLDCPKMHKIIKLVYYKEYC
jgi:hypothetical protein